MSGKINMGNIGSQLHSVLSSGALIRIAERLLSYINKEIVRHTERTSYLVMKLSPHCALKKENSLRNIVFLSLFHTLGFFREDIFFDYKPFSSKIDYFSNTPEVESKYRFGCYYLEFMTPIHRDALALESFTQAYNPEMARFIYQERYKSIINLCAHISDFINRFPDKPLPANLDEIAPGMMSPVYMEIFAQVNADQSLENAIRTEDFREELYDFVNSMQFSDEENKTLAKLLIYLLDFKSTVTMSHSVNTSCYAVSLGMRKGFDSQELSKLFISAVLHDIGKIATPQKILEYPGKLSPEDMGIMRYHVNHSKKILSGLVPDEILENVFRHHEKLNGQGYPRRLPGKELTLAQRILTIADITSALCDSRSYKGKFSKEQVVEIMMAMTESGEIDAGLTEIMIADFDEIQRELPVLQSILSADFSNVLAKYNEYIIDRTSVHHFGIITEEIGEPEELEEV